MWAAFPVSAQDNGGADPLTHSAGQPSTADDAPAPRATPIRPLVPSCSVSYTRLYVCSSRRFMPNWTEVMGSIAPALICIASHRKRAMIACHLGRGPSQSQHAAQTTSASGAAPQGLGTTLQWSAALVVPLAEHS